MNYTFHPEAEEEFLESAARYEAAVPGLGVRFGAEVERALQLLLKRPRLAPRVEGELRQLVLRQFPFSIVYAAAPRTLYILAIAHTSREPRYWLTRVVP
ncbi:MAG TPA: type II toxin-antitoxin system RelE/ParE family toxin [Candidatus Hydrogenedentes bacterium]|nr:type II toxin-antitoxin system RelE/ParE family toxin [Candidatus Hydrogenedentota bacterium]